MSAPDDFGSNKLWKGNRAALSLTFDDALACQLKNAVPEMDKRGIQGTFFAITNSKEYPLDVIGWRETLKKGHEIGGHGVNHRKADTLNETTAAYETGECKRALENHFGNVVTSFCYPYTDAPGLLQKAVENAGYKQARGGRVARADKYIRASERPNFYNLPCFHVNGATFTHGETQAWVDAALERNAWLTLMFHGIGEETAWDNVPTPAFIQFLNFLTDARKRGLWVAPFGTVAENYRDNQRR